MLYRRPGPPFEHMTCAHVFIAQINYQIFNKSSRRFFFLSLNCMCIHCCWWCLWRGSSGNSDSDSDSSILFISIFSLPFSRTRQFRFVTLSNHQSNPIKSDRKKCVPHSVSTRVCYPCTSPPPQKILISCNCGTLLWFSLLLISRFSVLHFQFQRSWAKFFECIIMKPLRTISGRARFIGLSAMETYARNVFLSV